MFLRMRSQVSLWTEAFPRRSAMVSADSRHLAGGAGIHRDWLCLDIPTRWGMFGVICCLGLSMILLAAFVRVPRYLVMTVASLTIATHDLLDGLKPVAFHSHQWLLFVLHRSGRAHFGEISLFVLFPLIPGVPLLCLVSAWPAF